MSYVRFLFLLAVFAPACVLTQQAWDELDVIDGALPPQGRLKW